MSHHRPGSGICSRPQVHKINVSVSQSACKTPRTLRSRAMCTRTMEHNIGVVRYPSHGKKTLQITVLDLVTLTWWPWPSNSLLVTSISSRSIRVPNFLTIAVRKNYSHFLIAQFPLKFRILVTTGHTVMHLSPPCMSNGGLDRNGNFSLHSTSHCLVLCLCMPHLQLADKLAAKLYPCGNLLQGLLQALTSLTTN